MEFLDLLEENGNQNPAIVVLNRKEPEPLQRMLEDTFKNQPVEVEDLELQDYGENTVVLVREGEVKASPPLEDLRDDVLMVNSDLYITGAKQLEDHTLPDVITELSDTRFELRGYPESNKEKLILIAVSRQIEKSAYRHGGTLRSAFQRLSRIKDESGTQTVYQKIADTPTDLHLYGTPDWIPIPDLDATIHTGYQSRFTDTWFVVHLPREGEPAALLAVETEPRTWQGFWTQDPEKVRSINQVVTRTM